LHIIDRCLCFKTFTPVFQSAVQRLGGTTAMH
jgi:hypothetical protein